MHIAIAGNIGAGKTTLTNMLSKHYGWETHFEDVEQNPYLNDFYEDMQRWSFNLQVYFLNSRFSQIQDIHSQEKTIIQDRTIYEDAYIFAPNLHSMGLMTTRDFENYFSLFNKIRNSILYRSIRVRFYLVVFIRFRERIIGIRRGKEIKIKFFEIKKCKHSYF